MRHRQARSVRLSRLPGLKIFPGALCVFSIGFLASSRGPRGICYNRSPGNLPIDIEPQEFARKPMRKHKAHPGALCVFL